ncbi:unnamed protein product, partial [Meganyctiphanes norvegica]
MCKKKKRQSGLAGRNLITIRSTIRKGSIKTYELHQPIKKNLTHCNEGHTSSWAAPGRQRSLACPNGPAEDIWTASGRPEICVAFITKLTTLEPTNQAPPRGGAVASRIWSIITVKRARHSVHAVYFFAKQDRMIMTDDNVISYVYSCIKRSVHLFIKRGHPMIFSWPKGPAKVIWAAKGRLSIFSWPVGPARMLLLAQKSTELGVLCITNIKGPAKYCKTKKCRIYPSRNDDINTQKTHTGKGIGKTGAKIHCKAQATQPPCKSYKHQHALNTVVFLLRHSIPATGNANKLKYLKNLQKLYGNDASPTLGFLSKMSGEHCIMSIESLRDNDLKEEILYEQKKEVNMVPVEEDLANNEQDPLLTNNEYSNNEDDMRIEDIYRREMSRIYLIEDNGDASPLKHAVIAKYLKMWMMLYPEITVQELRNIYQENKGTVHQAMEKMRQVNRERKLLNNQRRTKTKFYFPKSNGRKYIEGYFWEVTGEEKVLTKQRVEETNKNNEKKENDNKDGDNCQFQDSTSDKYLKMWKVLYPEVDTQEQRKIYIENNGNVPQTMNKIRKMNKERRTKVERRPTTDGLGIWTNGNKPYGPLL